MAAQPRSANLEATLVQRYRTPGRLHRAPAARQASRFTAARLPLLAHLQRRFSLDRTTVAGAWVAMPYALRFALPAHSPAAMTTSRPSTPSAGESFGLTPGRGPVERAIEQSGSGAAPRRVTAPAPTQGQPQSYSRQPLATPAAVVTRSLGSGGERVSAASPRAEQPIQRVVASNAGSEPPTDFAPSFVKTWGGAPSVAASNEFSQPNPVMVGAAPYGRPQGAAPTITVSEISLGHAQRSLQDEDKPVQRATAPGTSATLVSHAQRALQDKDEPVQRVTTPGTTGERVEASTMSGAVVQAKAVAPTLTQSSPLPLALPTVQTGRGAVKMLSRQQARLRPFAPTGATPMAHAGNRPTQVSTMPGAPTRQGITAQPTVTPTPTVAAVTTATVVRRTTAPTDSMPTASRESSPPPLVAPLRLQTPPAQPAVSGRPLTRSQPDAVVARHAVRPEYYAVGQTATGGATIASTSVMRDVAALPQAGAGLSTIVVGAPLPQQSLAGDAAVISRRAMRPQGGQTTTDATPTILAGGDTLTRPLPPQPAALYSSRPTAMYLARISEQRTARPQRHLTLPVAAQRAIVLAQAVNHPPAIAPLQRDTAAPADRAAPIVVTAQPTTLTTPGAVVEQPPVRGMMSTYTAASANTPAITAAQRELVGHAAQHAVGDGEVPSALGGAEALPVVTPSGWSAPPELTNRRQPATLPSLAAPAVWGAAVVNPASNGPLSALPYVQRSREPGQPTGNALNSTWLPAGSHGLAQRTVTLGGNGAPTAPMPATAPGFGTTTSMAMDKTWAGGTTSALDLERLADEVYAILERRTTIERESLGL